MIISDSGNRSILVANLNGSNPDVLLYLPSSVPGAKYCAFIILLTPKIKFYLMQTLRSLLLCSLLLDKFLVT